MIEQKQRRKWLPLSDFISRLILRNVILIVGIFKHIKSDNDLMYDEVVFIWIDEILDKVYFLLNQ
jgi:hypothetical protein